MLQVFVFVPYCFRIFPVCFPYLCPYVFRICFVDFPYLFRMFSVCVPCCFAMFMYVAYVSYFRVIDFLYFSRFLIHVFYPLRRGEICLARYVLLLHVHVQIVSMIVERVLTMFFDDV
jgi:hypothetical protein